MLSKIIFTASNLARKFGVDFHEIRNPAVVSMREQITALGSIEFKIDYYPDGSWSAESTNIDGIMTGSANVKDVDELLRDAIFTYYKIPPYICNDQLLRSSHEPVTVAQRVWAT